MQLSTLAVYPRVSADTTMAEWIRGAVFLSLCYPLPVPRAGWNKRIEYAPGAGSLALFPGIRLETCDEPLWNIQATIELQTSHVAKGCDRDNYSERALRKLCGECALLSPGFCLTLLCLFPKNLPHIFPCPPTGVYVYIYPQML